MSEVPSLQVLADNRDALLLAEVAALLHDIGKFCNLHIEAHANGGTRKWANDHAYKAIVDNPATQIRLDGSTKKPDALKYILKAGSLKAADFLDNRLKDFLTNTSLTILGETYTLAELIMLGTPGFATDKNREKLLDGKDGWLAAVLGVCHNEAHVDKQDPAKGEGMQTWPNVYISSAFGFEKEKVIVDNSPNSLDARLKNLQVPPRRESLLNELVYGLGDTRQPVNEVLLSDWAWIVAALFKSALGGALVQNQQFTIGQWRSWKDKLIDHNLRWRLLRVNFDVLGLYAKAVKIADLMGYQKAVEDACTAVKKLVEEEYPLGNEIYRDTSGIYFTFPDLDLPADLEQEIRRRVEAVEPELAPRIAVEQPQGNTPTEQLTRMLAEGRRQALQDLAQPFDARNLSPRWQQEWETADTGNHELCPVCRLRPMEEGQDACETCLKRRGSRIQGWRVDPQQTIWLDEVADTNGRLALIVGQFGLDDWLSGYLVQTMLVRAVENDPDKCVSKNPSPARLRRVWETTRTFWQNALDERDPQGNPIIPLVSKRLEIIPQDHGRLNLEKFHTYELVVKGVRVSLVWDGNRFIACDNLDYLAKPEQLGDRLENIATERKKFTLEEPAGYGAKNKVLGDVTIAQVNSLDQRYTPAIPILAEPRTFMALVPANRALEVVKAIKAKYEREMGKVRNRLPLTLGVVYFGRRTPLAAALDAGRRMLKRERHKEDLWQVSNVTQGALLPNGWPQEVKLTLSIGEQAVEIAVPTVMGDGATEDIWYPYWCVQGKPNDRKRRFDGSNEKQWVHVSELRNGDQVLFTPSTFDFEFLDTAGRRFEVTYAESGRRRANDKPQRPYWLEQVDAIEHTWRKMSKLSKSQIYQVRDLIEGKRAKWGKPRGAAALALPQDDVFRCFVGDVLREAGVYSEELERAALSGMLSDVLELYLEIMKENPKEGGNHE